MAPRQSSRPRTKGKKLTEPKSRIKPQSIPRGKYRPRKAPGAPHTAGERIRASRTALGLTQRELGEKLLTDQTTVSAWERGKSEKLAGPSLVALAMVLQTTPEALLTGAGWDRAVSGNSSDKANRAAEPYAADLIHLPAAPSVGEAMWVSREAPEHHQAMEPREVQAELKKALHDGRPVWVVVG
jgi:transcriptional regulator with XRE-family HTH domain